MLLPKDSDRVSFSGVVDSDQEDVNEAPSERSASPSSKARRPSSRAKGSGEVWRLTVQRPVAHIECKPQSLPAPGQLCTHERDLLLLEKTPLVRGKCFCLCPPSSW